MRSSTAPLPMCGAGGTIASLPLWLSADRQSEDFRDEALAAQAKLPPDPVGDFFQGGTFCSAEFTGDTGRTWD